MLGRSVNLTTLFLGRLRTKGEVDHKLVQAPPPPPPPPSVIFIAGRPKAAFLFWFFVDFRCGALLFMVIHVICGYKNGCEYKNGWE